MKKNLLLYILVIFLIIVNGFFLFNYIGKFDNKGPRGPKGPSSFIAKQLNFNDSQIEQFLEIDESHRNKIRIISEDLRELKKQLFDNISDISANETKIDSITTLIGNKEKERDMEIFFHFRKIQSICNEKQIKHFNNIMKDALHQNRRDGDRPPKPPRRN